MTSLFNLEDLQSDTYRWRRAGQGTMVHIFYQIFQLGRNASNRDQWKRIEEDQCGRARDIDAMYLKNFFEDNTKYFPAGVKVVCKPLGTLSEFERVIHEMDKDTMYEKFDCFLFAFLTFSEVDGRLHFNDTTLEKGLVPLDRVLGTVSELKVAWGKPKIFLIQSDEMSLSQEKMYIKGQGFQPKHVKIPSDADRLIIQSTIPQKVVPEKGPRRESFLVQAFVEAIKENHRSTKKDDLLTLTTEINKIVKEKIQSANPPPLRKDDLPVPLVTSTLTKLLNVQEAATVQ